MPGATKTVTATVVEITEQIDALQMQIGALDEAIGSASIDWRRAAADPAAVLRAAERMSLLERQRDAIRDAKAQAEQERDRVRAEGQARLAQEAADAAFSEITAEIKRRAALAGELEEVLARGSDILRAIHASGQSLRSMFATGKPAAVVTGLEIHEIANEVNQVDVRVWCDQYLLERLGPQLWDSQPITQFQRSQNTPGIAARIRREGDVVAARFRNAVQGRGLNG